MNNIKTNEIKTTAQILEELNAIRTTATATEVNKKIAEITEQLKADSKANLSARIDELLEMDRVSMFKEFINNPCYTAVKLSTDKESGDFKIIDRDRQIGFRQLDKAYIDKNDKNKTLANSLRYYGMVAHFTHNLCKNIAGELSEDVKKVTVPGFNGQPEKEFDFSGNSITALEKQLNAIAETILPTEICPKMIKADVKAIKAACMKEKMLVFTLQNENAIINKIFNAFEIRMNNKAYTLKSKAECHKVKTEKKNKKTAA